MNNLHHLFHFESSRMPNSLSLPQLPLYSQAIEINNSTIFTPVPHALKEVLFAANTLVALVSAVGNILAIITFLRIQNLQTSNNYYIIKMAISDLLYVVAKWPLYSRSRLSHVFQCKVVNYLGPVSIQFLSKASC